MVMVVVEVSVIFNVRGRVRVQNMVQIRPRYTDLIAAGRGRVQNMVGVTHTRILTPNRSLPLIP